MLFYIGFLVIYAGTTYAKQKIEISEEENHLENDLIFRQIINCISEEGVLIEEKFEKGKIKQEVAEECFPKVDNINIKIGEINVYSKESSIFYTDHQYTKPIYLPFKISRGLKPKIHPITLIIEKQKEEFLEL